MKKEKYSYSRLSQYKSCPFAYDLKYNQKKFFDPPTLVTSLGTLVHHIEEKISLSLMAGKSPNYDDLIEEIHKVDIPKKNPYDTKGGIFGIDILKERYTQEFFSPSDKTGFTYLGKVNGYIQNIRRQEEFMLAHPELEIFDVEHGFEFQYGGETIKGYIDRVLKYKGQNRYQIYDVKTRDRAFDKSDITTPLQHVVYGLALRQDLNLDEEPEEYFYDLVFLQEIQPAGTKGFIKRGIKQLDKIFEGIRSESYEPKPSPLCYWCSFSNTNPHVTEQGENCCPYYSKWTPENKSFEVMFPWNGPENNQELIRKLKEMQSPLNKFAGFEF